MIEMIRFNRTVFTKLVRIKLARIKPAVFSTSLILVVFLTMSQPVLAEVDYQTLEWTDLMPPIDLAAIQSQIIDHGQVPDSSSGPSWESDEDMIGLEIDSWGDLEESMQNDAYQSALVSTRTVDALNGKNVRIPGFIVPLEFDDDMTITQFFLVPYFGACIHMPPPPPNQLVLVNYPDGIQMEALYTPFWISGMLSIQVLENEVGTSAYAMEMDSLEVYEY